MKSNIFLIAFLLSAFIGNSQDQFRIMTYNVLNYGNATSYCTSSNNNFAQKEQYLKEIVAYYKPDVMGFNEVGSNSFVLNRILDTVFNSNVGWNYEMGAYSNTSGGYLINTLVFNADKFGLAKQHVLASEVRDIILFRLYYKDENLAQSNDTAFLNVIVSHLKASNTAEDRDRRELEVTTAMNKLISIYSSGNYLWMGDFNIYKSSEGAFQKLVNPTSSAYAFKDPLNKLGNWNNNSTYKSVHTQSTHSSNTGCAASGGLDDRFDMILMSSAVLNGSEHYSYINNSYKIPGNDGNHYNSSITSGSNNSAPASMIQTLYSMSDHLPVYLELEVDQMVGIQDVAQVPFELSHPNPIQNELQLKVVSREPIKVNLKVYNGIGQCVMSGDYKIQKGSQQLHINSSSWTNGLYFISLQGENRNSMTTKVLKI